MILKTLVERASFALHLQKGADHSLAQLLNTTIYGSPDSIQYCHTQVESRFDLQKGLHFITVKRNQHLIGCLGLNQRYAKVNGVEVATCYVRYFSLESFMKDRYRAKTKAATSTVGNHIMKKVVLDFFNDGACTVPLIEHEEDKILFYAYVELENARSSQMQHKYGFETICSFYTYIFSRIKPQMSKFVSRAEPDELDQVKQLIDQHYGQHVGYTQENLNLSSQFFVLREKGEIIAGVHTLPVVWEIKNVPGISGFLFKHILPRMPYVKSLFKGSTLSFLALEALLCKKGHEKRIPELLEAVLFETKHHSAQVYISPQDRLFGFFIRSKKLGLLHLLTGAVQVGVNAKGLNYSADEMEALKNKAMYISGMDVS